MKANIKRVTKARRRVLLVLVSERREKVKERERKICCTLWRLKRVKRMAVRVVGVNIFTFNP